jgi:zinc finger SWIM domain-containing protein 3
MTLFEMMQHYEHCLSCFQRNEAKLDVEALLSLPFTKTCASLIEKHAAQVFTPVIFDLVRWSIHATNKCDLIETQYGGDLVSYIIGRKDGTGAEMRFKVHCQFKE